MVEIFLSKYFLNALGNFKSYELVLIMFSICYLAFLSVPVPNWLSRAKEPLVSDGMLRQHWPRNQMDLRDRVLSV